MVVVGARLVGALRSDCPGWSRVVNRASHSRVNDVGPWRWQHRPMQWTGNGVALRHVRELFRMYPHLPELVCFALRRQVRPGGDGTLRGVLDVDRRTRRFLWDGRASGGGNG